MNRDRNLGMAIKQLNNLFNRRLQELSHDFESQANITGLQGWIVGYLLSRHEKKDVFQRDIENEFNIGRSTATALLQRMEQNGLLTRVSLPRDARWKKIILTPQALDMRSQIDAVKDRMESMTTQNLSDKELQMFLQVIGKIMKNLESSIFLPKEEAEN